MTEPKHSPLPWLIWRGILVDAKGATISTCTDDDSDENPPANARLILVSVNAHEKLLAAAKETIANFHDEELRTGISYSRMLVSLKAAIASAEKRT